MRRPSAGDDDELEPGSSPSSADATGCVRCGGRLVSMGVIELRTGGTGPGAHLLFGQWAELGEGKLPVEMFACSSCGHLELFQPA